MDGNDQKENQKEVYKVGQFDKKQLSIFAKALMPELYKIQARFNEWEKAIQDVVRASKKKELNSHLESLDSKGENEDA